MLCQYLQFLTLALKRYFVLQPCQKNYIHADKLCHLLLKTRSRLKQVPAGEGKTLMSLKCLPHRQQSWWIGFECNNFTIRLIYWLLLSSTRNLMVENINSSRFIVKATSRCVDKKNKWKALSFLKTTFLERTKSRRAFLMQSPTLYRWMRILVFEL